MSDYPFYNLTQCENGFQLQVKEPNGTKEDAMGSYTDFSTKYYVFTNLDEAIQWLKDNAFVATEAS